MTMSFTLVKYKASYSKKLKLKQKDLFFKRTVYVYDSN